MSQMGQSRHFDRAPITSGLLQQADLLRVRRHVSNDANSGHPPYRHNAADPRFYEFGSQEFESLQARHFGIRHRANLVRLRIDEVSSGAMVRDRATVIQKKTGRPVQFEITEQTRASLEAWLRILRATGSRYLFPSRLHARPHLSTRQYSRLVHRWIDSIGLKSIFYGTHSMRRTKVTLIYRKTGNLRAVQLLLGTATYCPRTPG